MKNLEMATKNELENMLELAIGRAFRMASKGNEKLALKAKSDAVLIGSELKARSK